MLLSNGRPFDCRNAKHNWTSRPDSVSLRETPSPPPLMLLGLSFQRNLAVWLRAMCHARVDFSHEFSHVNNSSFQSPTCAFSWMSLHKSLDAANQTTRPLPVLPGMRDFASRRARLRDCELLREVLAVRRPLDHGLCVRLHEVTLEEERIFTMFSLLPAADPWPADRSCQAEDVPAS